MPFGWAFMAAIVLLEISLISRLLGGAWWKKEYMWPVIVANAVSGAIGFAVSLFMTGSLVGWKTAALFISTSTPASQRIQRTPHADPRLLHHVGIDLRGLDALVPEQILPRKRLRLTRC